METCKAHVSAPFMRKDALDTVAEKWKSMSQDLFFPWESQGEALHLHRDMLTVSNYIESYLHEQ